MSSDPRSILGLYCSQPCATFSPYIFATKPKALQGAGVAVVRAVSARFLSRRAAAAGVGTPIAPPRREKRSLGADSRALSFEWPLLLSGGVEKHVTVQNRQRYG